MHEPTAIGPVEVQRANGVIDVVVADEAEAVAVAKHFLAFFQGAITNWEAAEPEALRDVVPVHRLRSYDVRRVIDPAESRHWLATLLHPASDDAPADRRGRRPNVDTW